MRPENYMSESETWEVTSIEIFSYVKSKFVAQMDHVFEVKLL